MAPTSMDEVFGRSTVLGPPVVNPAHDFPELGRPGIGAHQHPGDRLAEVPATRRN
jgi:hypothetical protein